MFCPYDDRMVYWWYRWPTLAIAKIKQKYYDIKTGIGNLIAYRKMVWEDRDWDHNFLLYLMQFKLQRMLKLFKSDKCHIDWSEGGHLEALQELIDIIGRIVSDEYQIAGFEAVEKKWGDFSFRTGMGKKVLSKEQEEEYHKDVRDYMDKGDAALTKDLKRFGEIIEKHMLAWWD